MILVNLLPHDLRPIKRTPLPHVLSLLALAGALVAMGIVFLSLQAEKSGKQAQLDKINARLKELEPIREDYKRLKSEEKTLRAKVEVIEAILEARIVWSEQLDRLVKLTPENIWYDRVWVSLEDDTREVVVLDEKTRQPVIDPKTNREKVETIKTKEHRLHISGYAKTDENGGLEITPLLNNLRSDSQFATIFPFKDARYEDTAFGGYPVRKFTSDYRITPGGGAS